MHGNSKKGERGLKLRVFSSAVLGACSGRAYGNLGLSHESLGNYEEAVKHQEQHLSIAAEMNDKVAKTLAYSSLGKQAIRLLVSWWGIP